MESSTWIKRNRNTLIKTALISSIVTISLLSSNNFINNDNYFPIAYLYLLEYPEFFNSLSSFIPFETPLVFRKILFNLFITPLSSTYAPLPYIFYPLLKLFNEIQNQMWAMSLLNISINTVILLLAYERFRNINKQTLFIYSYALTAFGIGHLIYVGSNMPYSYLLGISFLIFGMALDGKEFKSSDIWTLIVLFLLNYQTLYLLPAYFVVKLFSYNRNSLKSLLQKRQIVLAFTAIFLVVSSTLIFISLRGKLTGTHSEVSLNWNTGINKEFAFDTQHELLLEFWDFIRFLPRSIAYHLNSEFFNFEILSYVFWIISTIGLIRLIFNKKLNRPNLFYLVTIFTLTILILSGKAVYGPTRHTLFLLPITILFLIENFLKTDKKIIQTILICIILLNSSLNLKTIVNRKNSFFEKICLIDETIKSNPNHDLLLFSCTYQPFLDENFRNSTASRKIKFFCGGRLQELNSNLKDSDSIIIIDATGQSSKVIADELNKRLGKRSYFANEITLVENLLRLNYNMEQKDFTQLPKNTGLFIWEAKNKF